MPSFKELAKSAHRTLCRCLATIILSFCGISSFGMISIKGILGLGTAATLSLAILTTLSTPAFADQTSKSLDVNLTLGNSISVRILDSTATSDLSLLSFDLTPTAAGVTSTKRAIVDVSTSNITGYKLYVEANGKDHNNQYTTDLVQGDTADSHVIPTSTSTASNKNFWNYVNPATSTATVVPAHGNPDQIGILMSPTTSTKANVDINVGVDTTITAGSYTNQLLFTAIANAESIDYTLYFDKNAPAGVDPSDIENFPVNQTASASATSYTFTIPDTAPTLVGYTFGGYVDPEAEEGEKGSSTNPYLPGDDVTVVADPSASVISGTKTLNAQWQPMRTVTVTAGTGIASTTGSGDYSPGANVSIGATLSTGYHFADPKWTVNSGGVTISNDSFTMPDNDVSVTANGAINSCSVHYNSNAPSGETAGGSTANSSFNYGTATATTANGFTVTGYDWVGWAESAAGEAVISTSGGSMTAEQAASWCGTHGTTKQLYAKWTIKTYTVTVNKDSNTDSVSGGGTKAYKSTVTLSATPKTGYHFSSWTVNSGGVTTSNNQFTMPNNAVTVTANSAINTCTIHYNLNNPSGSTGSGSTANSSFNYNTSTATTTNGFSITGYQWSGWAESTTGTAVITTSGGNITATQAANWCGTHGSTKQLYAKWTKKYTYTLNLNTNDGTTNKQILNYPTSGGTTATSHTFTNLNSYAPTRAGYIFKGWATTTTGTSYVTSYTLQSSSAGSTPTSAGFPVTGNLYAIWEIGCANGANRICFIANAPSGTVSGTMADQTIVYMTSNTASGTVDSTALSSSTTELTLYSPNWTLSGYGFKGWNTKADGSGTMYGPNQTITLTATQKTQLGTTGLPLYAQWVASAGNMASWSGCSSLAQGSVTALTYGSDTYAIAKLADGKCWMIENLRTSTDAGTSTTSMSTSSYNSREYNLTNVSGSNPSPINTGGTAIQWKSYGGYYSWASAIKTTTAGSTQYSNWNGSSFSTLTTAAAQGICPSGWRLPRSYAGSATNNAESDFRNLNNELNGSWTTVYTAAASNNWRKYPNNFVFAGYWDGTSSLNRGTFSLYWSSTVNDSNYAYNLGINITTLLPADYYNKYRGYSVRCLIGS